MKHAASGASRLLAGRREPGRRRAGGRPVSGGLAGADGQGQSGEDIRAGGPVLAGGPVHRSGRAHPGQVAAGGVPPLVPPAPGLTGPAAPASPAAPARLAQAPYTIVLAGVVGSLTVIRFGAHYVGGGTLVLAGILLLAAVARLVLPDRRAGMLSSRRRLVDVVIFAVLGSGLLAAGWLVPA